MEALRNTHPADRPTLYRGSSGVWVTYLQRRLRAKGARALVADGAYGPKTEAAVDFLLGTPFVDRDAWSALEAAA